jgi:uncharacterized iron-regulated protein
MARSVLLSAALLTVGLLAGSGARAEGVCSTYGGWIDVKADRALDRKELIRDLVARAPIVLLGESHTDADHHRWQLYTVAALHGEGAELVIGFESFPRRLQPVLDDWVAGKLTADAFLKQSEWRQVWAFDPSLYMPLFEFARLNRIPMVAMNVERSLVSRVGQQGWDAIPVAEREGLTDPAPASLDYQRELAQIYLMKKMMPPGTNPASPGAGTHMSEPDEATIAEALKEPAFKRFVEAQLTWDRAMAEALAGAKRKSPNAIVVGILGSGHVANGYGVPHQLKSLGMPVASFVAAGADEACKLVGTSYADAVFVLPKSDDAPPPDRPRLGVALAQGEGAPRINQVVGGSVAEATGLQAGDHVVRAAGLAMKTPDDLVDVVGRQAFGTWLPLGIRRDGQEMELVAKFPPSRKQD